MKNETLGKMRKELLEKLLSDTMTTFTNHAGLLQVETEFTKAELSCKETFNN